MCWKSPIRLYEFIYLPKRSTSLSNSANDPSTVLLLTSCLPRVSEDVSKHLIFTGTKLNLRSVLMFTCFVTDSQSSLYQRGTKLTQKTCRKQLIYGCESGSVTSNIDLKLTNWKQCRNMDSTWSTSPRPRAKITSNIQGLTRLQVIRCYFRHLKKPLCLSDCSITLAYCLQHSLWSP